MATNVYTIIKRGDGIRTEGEASEAIDLGLFVEPDGSSNWQKQSSAGANAQKIIAVKSSDPDAVPSATLGASSGQVASGDTFTMEYCHSGMKVYAFLADGEDVAKGDALEMDGNGLLQKLTTVADSDSDAAAITYVTETTVNTVAHNASPDGNTVKIGLDNVGNPGLMSNMATDEEDKFLAFGATKSLQIAHAVANDDNFKYAADATMVHTVTHAASPGGNAVNVGILDGTPFLTSNLTNETANMVIEFTDSTRTYGLPIIYAAIPGGTALHFDEDGAAGTQLLADLSAINGGNDAYVPTSDPDFFIKITHDGSASSHGVDLKFDDDSDDRLEAAFAVGEADVDLALVERVAVLNDDGAVALYFDEDGDSGTGQLLANLATLGSEDLYLPVSGTPDSYIKITHDASADSNGAALYYDDGVDEQLEANFASGEADVDLATILRTITVSDTDTTTKYSSAIVAFADEAITASGATRIDAIIA